MKNKKRILVMSIILLEVVFTVVGYFILPETLVVQVTQSGEAGNTLPKIAGLAIPFSMCTIFSILYFFNENKKNLIAAICGLVMSILTFVFNG